MINFYSGTIEIDPSWDWMMHWQNVAVLTCCLYCQRVDEYHFTVRGDVCPRMCQCWGRLCASPVCFYVNGQICCVGKHLWKVQGSWPASIFWFFSPVIFSANGLLCYKHTHGESVALLVARRTNNRKVVGSRPTKVVCITVLTGNCLGWTARCDRPLLLLPSCRKLEFRLSALMDLDLAWVNGKSGRQSWRYMPTLSSTL